ncbi:MAG: hypothetical protein ACK4I8_04845 [Armatimonadota bacterium]
MPTLSAQVTYPVTLQDALILPNGQSVGVIWEVHEEGVIARLAEVPEVSSSGATVAEAKTNLVKAVQDELDFLRRHRIELSEPLRERLASLERILG